MIKHYPLAVPPDESLRKMGWNWMTREEYGAYFPDDMVVVTEAEVNAYQSAGDQLYDMFVEAGEHIIENELFEEMGIPENMERMIRQTWEDDRNLHVYGRFDLAGGVDGKPIKLLEFNADTPTALPETAVIQWAHLLANKLDETRQYNHVYEAIRKNFMTLKTLNNDLEPTLLISTMGAIDEDDTNVEVLGEAAKEAGFLVAYADVSDVEFSGEEGIFAKDAQGDYHRFNFWFKLVPWEFIAYDEPELLDLLDLIIGRRLAVVVNPPYTLLFQSKAILKVLWELYPDHPLLLATQYEPFTDRPCVEKVLFGREGQNVRIFDKRGDVLDAMEGEYDEFDRVYQEFVELPKDEEGNVYQAGVFFAYESCGLGFRYSETLIIDDAASFSGHIVVL
jgi:glutathionylspermidine synthase